MNSTPRRRPQTTMLSTGLLATLAVALFACPAEALVIDDLLTAQSVSSAGPTSSTVVGSMLGGARFMGVGGAASPVAGDIGGGTLLYTQDGAGQAFLDVSWEPGDFDLRAGGFDAFEVELGALTIEGALVLSVTTGTSNVSRVFIPLDPSAAPSTVVAAFDDFAATAGTGADFASVDFIGLRFQSASGAGAGSAAFGPLRTVPEPAVLLLLALVPLGLGRSR